MESESDATGTISIELLKIAENNESECCVAVEAVGRIINNSPRSVSNSENSRLNKYSVTIGAGEPTRQNEQISLVEYRKFLIAKFITSALGKSGYHVDPQQYCVIPNDNPFYHELFIIREDESGQKDALRFVAGHVTTKLKTLKEPKGINDMSTDCFHSLRMKGVKPVRVRQELSLSWLISSSNLTTAVMDYDILIKEPGSDIELLASEHKDSENSGMLFIMDNYARLITILRKFSDSVKSEEYPSLPPLEMVDFTQLTSKDELDLVKSIREWPRTVEETVDFSKLTINITANLKCIKELAARFNNFYSYTKILVSTKSPHNFNRMFARIYMLQACLKIFEEFLELMQTECDGSVQEHD